MKGIIRLLVPACLVFLSSCATQPPKTPVPAGHLYEGPHLDIHAPNSDGWHLVSSTGKGMEFAKMGSQRFESFGAQVLAFPLAPTTEEEFVTMIEEGVRADADPARFSVIETKFEYSQERTYPCVRVSSVMEDREAQVGAGRTEKLLLQSKALYCRHPSLPNTGMAIIYSHRGSDRYPNLDVEADDFIIGVQVPGD